MLGISLDSKDTVIANTENTRCKCPLGCTLGADCQCSGYCELYSDEYNYIKAKLTKFCWLTFSPKPRNETERQFNLSDERQLFKDFIRSFLKSKNIKNYIAVAELTKKGQIHYHVLCRFKSKVTFIKQVIQPLFYKGNIEPIYGSSPKFGLHYLFKEQDFMYDYFGERSGVFIGRNV